MRGTRRSIRGGVALPKARMLTERLSDTEAGSAMDRNGHHPPVAEVTDGWPVASALQSLMSFRKSWRVP